MCIYIYIHAGGAGLQELLDRVAVEVPLGVDRGLMNIIVNIVLYMYMYSHNCNSINTYTYTYIYI